MSQHSNQILPLYSSYDVEIIKGKNCYIFDINGKRYVDFESGVWCVNLGHCNERINSIIHRQIDEIVHHGYAFSNRFAEKLSQELLNKLSLDDGKSVFLSSGSEAVNLAITIAKRITWKDKILSLENSYLSAYGHGQYLNNPNYIRVEIGDPESIEFIDFSDIAAFVFEPGTARGTVTFPPKELVRAITNRARSNGCLVVIDEVTTGLGRSGRWFGHNHYDILPDMVATGKGLGNGYPISAVSVSKDTAKVIEEKGMVYAQSHQNDPLGCAIGLEVMKVLSEQNLIERSDEVGTYFMSLLKEMGQKHDTIKEIRGRGMMLAVEFQTNIDIIKIKEKLFMAGFAVRTAPNVLRFMPPLTIKKRRHRKFNVQN